MIRYSVEPGDRLSEIARRFHLTTTDIVHTNAWREPATLSSGELVFKEITPGDVLCIPTMLGDNPGEGGGGPPPTTPMPMQPQDPMDCRRPKQCYVTESRPNAHGACPPGERSYRLKDGRVVCVSHVPQAILAGGGMLGEPGTLGAVSPDALTTGQFCGNAKLVQQALNDLGFGPLSVDGQLGQKSFAAMDQFGSKYGLGKVTWASPAFCQALKTALQALVPPPQPASPPAGTSQADACTNSGGTWNGQQCVFPPTPSTGGGTPAPTPDTSTPDGGDGGDGGQTTDALATTMTPAVKYTLIGVGVVAFVGLVTTAAVVIAKKNKKSK